MEDGETKDRVAETSGSSRRKERMKGIMVDTRQGKSWKERRAYELVWMVCVVLSR